MKKKLTALILALALSLVFLGRTMRAAEAKFGAQ